MVENILRTLGIIGWEKIEDFLLAGLLTGDSVLLTGTHGSAKTYCARRISEALNVKLKTLDSSKAEFEDYLGVINPAALSQGRFEYVSTPLTIIDGDFLFLDEINRCRASTANKLLEIVYNRKFYGLQTSIKWCWAACNVGAEYSGTEPLDPAFSARFALVIPVPDITDFSKEDIEKIASISTEEDAIALKYWDKRFLSEKAAGQQDNSGLKELLKKAAEYYRLYSENLNLAITHYLSVFVRICHQEAKIKIDGRRISMMRRNALAYLSIKSAKNGVDFAVSDIYKTMKLVLPYSFPDMEIPVGNLKLNVAFTLTESFIQKESAYSQAIFSKTVLDKIKIVLNERELSDFARKKILK